MSCSKGVKDPLEVPEVGVIRLETPQWKWASSLLEGRTSCIFSNCDRCSRLMRGTSGTRSGGLRKGQSPCELLGGLLGFLSRGCQGQRTCVESVPETVDSSRVLTWIVAYFWSFPRGVSPRLVWGHARAHSSQAVAAVSRFPSRGSRDLWLSLESSHEAFSQGYSTCHHGVIDPRRESRTSAGKTGTSFPTVGDTLSPWAGISRALALGVCPRRCRPQAPREKSPKWH